MGLSLEEAEWLLVLYRFAPPQAFGEGESGDAPRTWTALDGARVGGVGGERCFSVGREA